MNNTKKIISFCFILIFLQTKNIKPVSKETFEKMHILTSLVTFAHQVIPYWVPETKNHKNWHNLEFKTKIPNDITNFINQKTDINLSETAINFYLPTIINQSIAASIDKEIDITSEIIENIKRLNSFFIKIKDLNDDKKTRIPNEEFLITTLEVLTKTLSKATLNKIFKNHSTLKRFTKITILTGIDFGGNWLRKKIETEMAELFPEYKTVIANSLFKNIIIEVTGEIIQKLFIDSNQTNKQKLLQEHIKAMMSNSELALKLKDLTNETKPIEIK
ncbi:MAG: hypothetical protein ABIF12_03465 [bacterium]